jgi:peptidyl carrier protein
MFDDEVSSQLLRYIGDNFLAGDVHRELDLDTPLLEWGVLSSLNTATLLNHIRAQYGIAVPPVRINATNFRTVRAITAMIRELSAVPSVASEVGVGDERVEA